MIKFTRSDVKTILFDADAYLRGSIGQTIVLEKVKSLNYDEKSLAEGQKFVMKMMRSMMKMKMQKNSLPPVSDPKLKSY